ncbi:TetR/AcrR family transcriptional regulator [Rugosimonospora africana]|uniref:TetR/AcrR family transcriptional regulator n=1 Tax=Rugosimonospora africana TaxID=556532 RepID=UPI001944E2C0|nr:TetR/AcrR family transcriptional regulator [Rugosimonospora africana]
MTTETTAGEQPASRGGRGARERILRAATDLFYEQGIGNTGVEQLAEAAHVSKRTLYQHFPSKDELIVGYLRRVTEQRLPALTGVLADTGMTARERLLGVFDVDAARGCPFVNAAAELADAEHPARRVCSENKQAFIDTLIRLAAEAGARDPDALGHQLAVLYDGATAQGGALHSTQPAYHARAAAAALIDLATA